jgi:hypothetical protein
MEGSVSAETNPFAELINVLKSNGYTSTNIQGVPGPVFFNLLQKAGWKEAWSGAPGKSTHILDRLKKRGPHFGILTLRDFAGFLEHGQMLGANGWGSMRHGAKVIVNWQRRGFVTFTPLGADDADEE